MENDYKVADIKLAEFGRREISLAENEMPALMALSCLLYTSPSPRDDELSRMPSSA